MALLKSFLRQLETSAYRHHDNDAAEDGQSGRQNHDILPLPPKDRAWGRLSYFAFWFAAASSVADWYAVSTAYAAGLSVWEALFTLFGGRVISSWFMLANGRPGAMYGIPLPAVVRASFGIYGSMWPIISRACLSIIYNGLNLVQGSLCVYVMLHAIFPSIAYLPEVMPANAGFTTGQLIGLVILWALVFCLLFVPIPRLKIFIYLKVAAFFIAALSLLIWCSGLAGGIGAVVRQPSKFSGTKRAWLLTRFFFLGIANTTTFIMNSSDLQRYSKRADSPNWGQLVGAPLANLIVHLFGVLVSSSSSIIFGEVVWNPMLLLDRIQSENYTPENRAGCFFIALLFVYSSMISMILENSLPAGNDLAGMLPRFISYHRGTIICAVISIAMNPWYLLTSASTFLNFISSFGVFLAPSCGVMLAHYFVIVRGYISIPDLYSSSRDGPYYYIYGFNWRAYAAYICALAPNLYGFSGALGNKIPLEASHAYNFMFEIGVVVSFCVYIVLCYCWKIPHQVPLSQKGWREIDPYRRSSLQVLDAISASERGDAGAQTPIKTDEKTI
ncbi:hypothetical protein PMG11_11300 [Penicillium brasilianum]|uniref:Allantoin permease n=1 Tax=Penicillium brasilianum TaxID=104259 RepID=A0A0F7U1R5_PENBI|nr:hypothetical protein PMG11_11300 [Penicillium brasilianum]